MKQYKKDQNKNRHVNNSSSQTSGKHTIEDNRPKTVILRKLKSMAENVSDATVQKKASGTGLPADLKSGVESLSGESMDDVNVHYNSPKPAQLNAHAYARGNEIHIAPSQEKHLPHEAWHVVQQKQGRVKPTTQLKEKIPINDDPSLEREADIMGQKASQHSPTENPSNSAQSDIQLVGIAQLATDEKLQDSDTLAGIDDQEKEIVKSDQLGGLGYEDEKAAGLNKQISTEGDVSWRSKVAGFFWEEGTWSKFLAAVELYNKAENIGDKQKHLVTLKKEAYEWLKSKEEKVKKKETSDSDNDQKKYDTIKRFIDLTTSNHPEIIKAYDNLLQKMSAFKEDIIGKRKEFEGLVRDYKTIDKKISDFKTIYPPAVNLHFAKEWAAIKAKKEDVSKDIQVKTETKSIGSYITIKDPTTLFNVARGEVALQGGLGINIADIEVDEKTKIKITLDEKGEYKSLSVHEGELKAKIGDMEVALNNLDYANDVLSAETASGKVKIMEREVGLSVSKARVDQSGFDFDSITGMLDEANLEILKLKKPKLTYTKAKNSFEGNFDYELNLSSPFDQNAKSDGSFDFLWSPKDSSKRNFTLDKANFEFGLLGQKLTTKNTSYDHKKRTLAAEEADLTLDLIFFKSKKFKGENVAVGRTYFDFTELSLESDIGEMPFGPLAIKPTQYAIFNDEAKGYGVKVDGQVSLNVPKALDASANASFKGYAAIPFKEKTPIVELTEGNANLEFANPLAKLGDFLGDNWTNTRFELGATIPVFTGVSAIFGLYLQLLATLPDKIKGAAVLKDQKLDLNIGIEAGIGVEGGVFGGVQAGSQLLLALAALLRAAGTFDMNAEVGYHKEVDLKPNSTEKTDSDITESTDGFVYSLGGGVKVGAYLDLVATALYFFKKTFTLTLKEWDLGEFKFTNEKEKAKKPDTGSKTLFKDDELKSKLDKDAVKDHPEIKGLSADKLLDQRENQRYSGKEKEEILGIITDAETGRADSLKAAKAKREEKKGVAGSLGAEEVFDNVALANMLFFDRYVDKFVTWDVVQQLLTRMSEVSKTEDNVDEKKAAIKDDLMILKDKLTIPDLFQKHFSELMEQFIAAYKDYNLSTLTDYNDYLSAKAIALSKVHTFKREIHSRFWGDESKIDSKMRSWSWFGVGDSPLTTTINEIGELKKELDKVKDTLKFADAKARYQMGEQVLKDLNKEHQKLMDAKRSKMIRPVSTST